MSILSDNPFEPNAELDAVSSSSQDSMLYYNDDEENANASNTELDNDSDDDTLKISEMDVGKAIIAQQKVYNSLLGERIKFQKKMQHFNNLQDMPVIELENLNLDENLQSYYKLLSKDSKKFKSYDDLDVLYNQLLDQSQQDTKLKGMQPVSEQIVNILDKDSVRLVKKTKLNRVSKLEHVDFFDDCDFYAILLKEYLEQKSDSPDAQAKIKKFKQTIKIHTRLVDRRASKAKLLNTEKNSRKDQRFCTHCKKISWRMGDRKHRYVS